LNKHHQQGKKPLQQELSMQTIYDYIVIGAGPAGLQVAYNLQKHQANYLVLEATIPHFSPMPITCSVISTILLPIIN
jgi:thioredoxin reductase